MILIISKTNIMLKAYRVLSFLFLISLCSFGLFSCSDSFDDTEPIILNESERKLKRCDICPPAKIVDPDARGYKLVIETADWVYTGQDLSTGHEIWDCVDYKTRTWVFRNENDCMCQYFGWNSKWNKDAICITPIVICEDGNFEPKDFCSF